MADTAVRRKMAEAVRAERARRDWSQVELAAKAGVAPRRIVQIETEQGDLKFSTVEKVLRPLNLRMSVEAA